MIMIIVFMKKWNSSRKISLHQLLLYFYIKIIENNNGDISESEKICSLSNDLELILPYEETKN